MLVLVSRLDNTVTRLSRYVWYNLSVPNIEVTSKVTDYKIGALRKQDKTFPVPNASNHR